MSLEKRVVTLEERLTPRRFINLMTFSGETEDELIERYREEHGQNSITDSDTVIHTSIEFVAAGPSRYTEYPAPSSNDTTNQPDKTFIGHIEKGFDFLGYHVSPRG